MPVTRNVFVQQCPDNRKTMFDVVQQKALDAVCSALCLREFGVGQTEYMCVFVFCRVYLGVFAHAIV